MVRADSARVMLHGQPTEVGFVSTRAVDAESAADAARLGKRDVLDELGGWLADPGIGPELHVDAITTVSWWWHRIRPPKGFTFFTVADEHGDAELTYSAVEKPK
jgi:hypothetical protein